VEKWEGRNEESDDDQSLTAVGNKSDGMDVDATEQDPSPDEEDKADDVEDDEGSDDEDTEDPSDVAMVPFADILNARYHSENVRDGFVFSETDFGLSILIPHLRPSCAMNVKTCRWFVRGTSRLESRLYDDHPKFSLMLTQYHQWNTYGDPPNSDLLRRYGHVDLIPLSNGVRGNPADVVDIRADVVLDVVRSQLQDIRDTLPERIEWWLEEGGDELSWFSCLISVDTKHHSSVFTLETNYALPDELVSLIRLLLMPGVEWEKTKGKGKLPKPKMDNVVLQIAESVLKKLLENYKTTLEVCKINPILVLLPDCITWLNLQDDEAFLDATHEVGTVKYMATVVRVGEKRILRGAVGEIKRRLGNENKGHKKRPMESDESKTSSKKMKRR
jgi:N-lysine methyltransferase SETD6